MSSSGFRVPIVVVVCLLVAASAGHVRKSAFKTPVRRTQPQFNCVQRASLCVFPFAMAIAMVPQDVLLDQLRTEGINDICQQATAVKDCIQRTLGECDDDEDIPDQLRQAFFMTTEMINFVCVEQKTAINADRQCMFNEDLISASKTRCGHGSGQICQVVEESECGIALYESECNNHELANSVRAFLQRLESESDCDTVVSMKWRELVDMMRRR